MDGFTPSSRNAQVPPPENLDAPTLTPTGSPPKDEVAINPAAPSAAGDPTDIQSTEETPSPSESMPNDAPPAGEWPLPTNPT